MAFGHILLAIDRDFTLTKVKKKHKNFGVILSLCLLLSGCGGGDRITRNSEYTYGNIKNHLVKNQTTKAQVVEIFGPANVTTTDSEGLDMWVYQKISTVKVDRALGGNAGLSGGLSTLLGESEALLNASGVVGLNGGSRTTTQSSKTVTMIIKFNAQDVVVDYSFRTSNF